MTSRAKMVPCKTRSKDRKLQKLQTGILKAVGVISKTKKINSINFKESLSSIVHDCTDSVAMVSHVNSLVEQNRRDNIAFTIDRQYHYLRKNIPSNSKELLKVMSQKECLHNKQQKTFPNEIKKI